MWAIHITFNEVRKDGPDREHHFLMIDRKATPVIQHLSHELTHHAGVPRKREKDAKIVGHCTERNEDEEQEEEKKEEEEKKIKRGNTGGGGQCFGCGGGGGGSVTVTIEEWECTWSPGVSCEVGDDGVLENCYRIWIFEGCRRTG